MTYHILLDRRHGHNCNPQRKSFHFHSDARLSYAEFGQLALANDFVSLLFKDVRSRLNTEMIINIPSFNISDERDRRTSCILSTKQDKNSTTGMKKVRVQIQDYVNVHTKFTRKTLIMMYQ